VPVHIKSAFYEQEKFMAGQTSLRNIELALLGEVNNKDIIHLQCHFGQDSISLARMGANVLGVDFSDKAIEVARELNAELKLNANFICCDVHDTLSYVDQKYDIVFASYGVIGWLPDLKKWAQVISSLLKPGGRFVFVEFHPVVWMLDESFNGVKYHYFNKEVIIESTEGTYAEKKSEIQNKSISWNHSFGEIIQNLIDAGLQIKQFQEFDYSPYTCFDRLVQIEENKFQVDGLEGKIPMVYALEAIKP
jgi:2-polyprenyl-3-methyl-5-hydroxy-6-metoxy-1,4-benzoquinol methylase